mgnify:FL=1
MREQDKLHIRENVQAMYIFELLMGWLDRSILTPEQDDKIEYVFAKGAAGSRLYGEMMESYSRLSERLHPGKEDDADVEVFFNCALDMCEEVGLKMYRYGRYYALHPEAFPAMYDDYASYYLHEAGQEQSADAPV